MTATVGVVTLELVLWAAQSATLPAELLHSERLCRASVERSEPVRLALYRSGQRAPLVSVPLARSGPWVQVQLVRVPQGRLAPSPQGPSPQALVLPGQNLPVLLPQVLKVAAANRAAVCGRLPSAVPHPKQAQ